MNWCKAVFGQEKPVIGLLHLNAFPGEPLYKSVDSMKKTVEDARTDLKAQSIHVEFVSGTETYDGGVPHWAYNVPIVYGGSITANVHGGSTLTVDDLALIYE